MRRSWALLASAMVLCVGCTSDEAKDEGAPPGPPEPPTLQVELVGWAEAPTPGDPDGAGRATVRFDDDNKAICVDLTVDKLDRVAAVHLQQAPAGQPGPIVAALPSPQEGSTSASGCVTVDDVRYSAVKGSPELFFVNVRTTSHPAGAVRGQLAGGNGAPPTTTPRPPTGPPTGPPTSAGPAPTAAPKPGS